MIEYYGGMSVMYLHAISIKCDFSDSLIRKKKNHIKHKI